MADVPVPSIEVVAPDPTASVLGVVAGGLVKNLQAGPSFGQLAAPDGISKLGFKALDAYEKLGEIETPSDTDGTPWTWLKITRGNWGEKGGRNYFLNPDAVIVESTLKNGVTVLGGRGDIGYNVTVGPLAELSFHGGGGDNYINQLASVTCGGAHHIQTQNSAGTGSHCFIGGGSYQSTYGDYAVIVGGTENTNWAIKAAICGGQGIRIGQDGDQTIGRNSFAGSGYLNTLDGQYSWIPSGQRCKVTQDYSGAYGYQAVSNLYGSVAQASGAFTTDGDSQILKASIRRITTNALAAQLLLDGASKTLTMGSNTLWTAVARVNAYRTDAAETASYVLTFSAICLAGVTTIKGTPTLTVLHEDNAAYNVDVIASGAQVQIRGTGVASSNIRWTASLEIVETRNI